MPPLDLGHPWHARVWQRAWVKRKKRVGLNAPSASHPSMARIGPSAKGVKPGTRQIGRDFGRGIVGHEKRGPVFSEPFCQRGQALALAQLPNGVVRRVHVCQCKPVVGRWLLVRQWRAWLPLKPPRFHSIHGVSLQNLRQGLDFCGHCRLISVWTSSCLCPIEPAKPLVPVQRWTTHPRLSLRPCPTSHTSRGC